MDWVVPLADLDYGVEEETAVQDVLRSRWLTMGTVTQQFETEFARLTGSQYAVAVSNATQALHLACLALEIGPGDEIITPSLSFVATASAVLYTGAEVRFADITSLDDLTIATGEIERQITSRTRAIIVMHYAGYPCDMPEIMRLARHHNLAVIEDAAHAPGAALAGKALGAWGDVGCFSFFANKNISTGEGGMLVTDRADLASKLRLLRSHGMTSQTWDRHRGHTYTYDVVALGYNYRIDEMRAALGRVQLGKLAENNMRRQAITRMYWQAFAGLGCGLPFSGNDPEPSSLPACHIFPLLLPIGVNRQRFIDRLREAGVQTSIHYPPIHLFQYYRQRYPAVTLPTTEEATAREVTLPLFPSMSDEQISLVIDAVTRALKHAE